MPNYFKDEPAGYRVSNVEVTKNSDGTFTRRVTVPGVKVNYIFSGIGAQEILADVTFNFHLPSTVDEEELSTTGPLKFGHAYYVGAWMGELDVPEEFQP